MRSPVLAFGSAADQAYLMCSELSRQPRATGKPVVGLVGVCLEDKTTTDTSGSECLGWKSLDPV
jgi:hypothetical protein